MANSVVGGIPFRPISVSVFPAFARVFSLNIFSAFFYPFIVVLTSESGFHFSLCFESPPRFFCCLYSLGLFPHYRLPRPPHVTAKENTLERFHCVRISFSNVVRSSPVPSAFFFSLYFLTFFCRFAKIPLRRLFFFFVPSSFSSLLLRSLQALLPLISALLIWTK